MWNVIMLCVSYALVAWLLFRPFRRGLHALVVKGKRTGDLQLSPQEEMRVVGIVARCCTVVWPIALVAWFLYQVLLVVAFFRGMTAR